MLATVGISVAWLAPALHAQAPRKNNPAGKIYFADVSGEAQIATNDRVEDIAKRAVYETQGVVIETKKGESSSEAAKTYSTMVYSNGTAAYFGEGTRVEVKKFLQDPFKPDRGDMSMEPSISKTQVFIARGTVALSTSELVAGSSMIYDTPFGTVNIRGRKVVIETDDDGTTISMLEGESTVQLGGFDLGGHVVKAGEQAVIRSGGPGQANVIEIRPIPPVRMNTLDDMVSIAAMAQKTVYFQVKDRAAAPVAPVASPLPGAPRKRPPPRPPTKRRRSPLKARRPTVNFRFPVPCGRKSSRSKSCR